MSPETLPVFRDVAKVKKKNLNCFFFYLFWLQRRCFKIYTVALSMQETCPNHSSEREVTGENGRRQASVDDCRQICTCRHYPCLHAQYSPPFFPVIPIRKVLPLKRRRRMSYRAHSFNVRDRSSGESIHFLFLHLCLFDAVLCSRPRQYIARSGPSTRLVSADNTICDRHPHICGKGRFNPAVIIYSNALTADLHGKSLPDSADVYSASAATDV